MTFNLPKRLQQEGLALVPGSAFGPKRIRRLFATSMQQLRGAMERLERLVDKRFAENHVFF